MSSDEMVDQKSSKAINPSYPLLPFWDESMYDDENVFSFSNLASFLVTSIIAHCRAKAIERDNEMWKK